MIQEHMLSGAGSASQKLVRSSGVPPLRQDLTPREVTALKNWQLLGRADVRAERFAATSRA
jgi:hypothetical protein